MNPAEIKKAAEDVNNKIRVVEIQLREKVVGLFAKSKPSVFEMINNHLITVDTLL